MECPICDAKLSREDDEHLCLPYVERFDAIKTENDLLQANLDKAMDYINDLADNGFEIARAVRDEIEGMK